MSSVKTGIEHFTKEYAQLLLMVGALAQLPKELESSAPDYLIAARYQAQQNPSLIDKAVEVLQQQNKPVDMQVVKALQSLKLGRYFYIKDTPKYSILVSFDQTQAYAIVNLGDKLKALVGQTGMLLLVGLVEYAGQYMLDGIVEEAKPLALPLQQEVVDCYNQLKKAGKLLQ